MLCAVERLGPDAVREVKGTKDVCANVDLFSGLIYRMLGISEDLFTPLFAISRIPGWCAHRVEEVVFANRIMRPAYKYLGHEAGIYTVRGTWMKKAFCTGTLAVSLLLGAARAADLFLNTDTATGFLLSGSVWTRYWLMAPVVILAWLAGLYVPRKQPCGLRPGAGVWMSGVNFVFVPLAFCSELYGFLTVLNVLFARRSRRAATRRRSAPAGAAGGCDARGAVRRVRRVVPSGVF